MERWGEKRKMGVSKLADQELSADQNERDRHNYLLASFLALARPWPATAALFETPNVAFLQNAIF